MIREFCVTLALVVDLWLSGCALADTPTTARYERDGTVTRVFDPLQASVLERG
jgi:hypothetical protein